MLRVHSRERCRRTTSYRTYSAKGAGSRTERRLRGEAEQLNLAWPAPKTDAIEVLAAKYAGSGRHGARKIPAKMRADGHAVSTSTVERALR